ncbi:MAG TPA: hypothetical protein VIK78_07305 [Ruminiclostridium sp.]
MDNTYLMDSLKVFIEDRSNDIACIFENKKKYLELDEQIDKLIDSISQSEGEDLKHLIIELKDAISKRNTIIIEALYKEGLIDGLSFVNTLIHIKN